MEGSRQDRSVGISDNRRMDAFFRSHIDALPNGSHRLTLEDGGRAVIKRRRTALLGSLPWKRMDWLC